MQPHNHQQSTQTSLQSALDSIGYELRDAFDEWLVDRHDLIKRARALVLKAAVPYSVVYRHAKGSAPLAYVAIFPDESAARRYVQYMSQSWGDWEYGVSAVTQETVAEIPDTVFVRVCGSGGKEFIAQEDGYTRAFAEKYASLPRTTYR